MEIEKLLKSEEIKLVKINATKYTDSELGKIVSPASLYAAYCAGFRFGNYNYGLDEDFNLDTYKKEFIKLSDCDRDLTYEKIYQCYCKGYEIAHDEIYKNTELNKLKENY